MALSFYDNEDDKKKSNVEKVANSIGGFFKHPSEIPGKVARATLGNTAKFANQAYQEGKQVVDTTKMLTAQATGNDQAFQSANERSQNDYKGFKKNGGFFNAGTLTSGEEAKKGDLETGVKKIGGGTAGVATEVVPFARGATLAKAGGSVLENVGRSAAEGAGYGAIGSAAQQEVESGKVDLGQTARDALIGAGTGAAGFGATKGAEAGVGKLKDVNANLGEGGFIGKDQTAPDLINTDLNQTAPADARQAIATTKSMDIKPVVKAQAALAGEKPATSEAITPVGQGAENIAKKLDDQLSTFDSKLAAPKEIMDKLQTGSAVTRDARKHDWLNHYEDTLSVLGRHYGRQGTDLGYKLAEGAKQVSDIQEVVRPSIDNTQKLLNGMSKSKSGRADIQSRVYSALEDRANADQYLTSPKERELFNETSKVLDFFKQQRETRGKSVVGENYSPRAAVSNALDAPDRLLDDARNAFSTDVKSRFSRERIAKVPDAEINRNIIDLLPSYSASQAKEFGYEGALKYAKENLQNVNPAYVTDKKSVRQGEEYLQNLLQQVLDPRSISKSERFQNKLIGNTYKAQLGWSPRFALQNMTQRFATKAVVSKEAVRLAGGGKGRILPNQRIDPADIDSLRQGIISGDNPITSDMLQSSESVGNSKGKLSKIEPGQAVERGNVRGAFDKGVAQAVVESQPYKEAIQKGLSPRDAAKFALQDDVVKDLATRRGNIVVNDTQFGANFVTKPEFFRDTSTFFGLSDKWYKQYQRFPQGMIQNMSTILRAKDARALDILKRGNPAETNLVDYKYSAEALHNGVDDLIKGIKNGEVTDVSLEVAEGYKKSLGKAVDELDKQIKAHSTIRGGKTVKSVGKMWAAASAIQFLFDGGFAMNEDDKNKELSKAVQFGAPISIPTKDQNPLAGAAIPSSPVRPTSNGAEFQPRRLLNFVPGVGVAVNRGRDINRFVQALTGDGQ